jgi:hypothetical protein
VISGALLGSLFAPWTAAVAASPAEDVCVAEPGAEARAVQALIASMTPASVRAARAALVTNRPAPLVPFEDWAAWLPIAPAANGASPELRTAMVVDPADRRRGWLAVELAAPLAERLTPLHLTLLVDLSPSMLTVPMVGFPVLQDEMPVAGCCDAISRLDLAKAVLHELVDLLPPASELSLVVFVRDQAEVRIARRAVAADPDAFHHAIDGIVPWSFAPRGDTIDIVEAAALEDRDPCTDHRIFLVTDDRARISMDVQRTDDAIARWSELGVELWAVSVGVLDGDVSQLAASAARGKGVLLRADTLSEGRRALIGALRTAGTVARSPAVRVVPGSGLLAWRRVGGPPTPLDADLWTLPEQLPGGFGQAALYELTLDPARGRPVVVVEASAGSAIPGDWVWSDRQRPAPAPLADAPGFLRRPLLASLLSAQLAGGKARPDLVRTLVMEDGAEKELAAWMAELE